MKVNFSNSECSFRENVLNSYSAPKTVENSSNWSRKKCNYGLVMLSTALIEGFASKPLTDLYIKRIPTTKCHPLTIHARIGMGILAAGVAAAYMLNKVDEIRHIRLGDLAYKLFNGPNAK